MGLTYFKRYRMEIELGGRSIAPAALPPGYALVPWADSLLDAHAETKCASFRSEIDANVFPCLGDLVGCQRLMGEIRNKDGFLPEATWLVSWQSRRGVALEFVGTIQGICDAARFGAVQNLGVIPEHRGVGLGGCLLRQALLGFQRAGLARAFLEVTAQNGGAIRLYQRLGFTRSRTVYKAVEVAYS